MKIEPLSDQQLVDSIRSHHPIDQATIDEYYRRCIPLYLEFIGIHWHTGFYLDDGQEACPADQERMNRKIADSIALGANDLVLDIGCGVGGTTCHLAQAYGCRIHGLSPVEAQRQLAQVIAARRGIEHLVRFDAGHADSLPYESNSFDAIVFFESPCHFPDRQRFFDEAFRVLKPSGRLAGEDWLAVNAGPGNEAMLNAISHTWAMPRLADGTAYLAHLKAAGFIDMEHVDMRHEMHIGKGFAVTPPQQAMLAEEIRGCENPLLALTLEGLLTLAQALTANVFTVGRFAARKPAAGL